MAVIKGRLVRKEFYIEAEGKKHFIPKGCDPIIGPQLQSLAGREIEVLTVHDTVLAIRPVKWEPEFKIPPIITCYLIALEVAFGPRVMEKIEPAITETLLESGYLDRATIGALREWQQM